MLDVFRTADHTGQIFIPHRLSCLERVMRSAARLIGKIQKFDHVTRYMLDVLHWLPVRQRIQYRVVSLVWRSQFGLAPAYLRDLCRAVSGAQVSRSLRSAERDVLVVPFARTASMQNRAFSVAGPWVWNDLPHELPPLPKFFTHTIL